MTSIPLKNAMEDYMVLARAADSDTAREHYSGSSAQVDRYLSVSQFRKHKLQIDEPTDFGGSDTAANPAEALLAALAASIEVTCRAWSEYLAIPCGQISTIVCGDLDVRGFMDTDPAIKSGFNSIKVELRVSGEVTAAHLQELQRLVTRCCPILDTVHRGSDVDVKVLRLEDAPVTPQR
jgi:pyruvate dehydrogenase E2 component (dihydrolipoamide acetyltransferase)